MHEPVRAPKSILYKICGRLLRMKGKSSFRNKQAKHS